jgi:hypothetical protein
MQGAGRRIQRFRVEVILDDLPEDEAQQVLAALHDPNVLTSKIAQVLSKHGHPISSNAVSNYRQQKCVES